MVGATEYLNPYSTLKDCDPKDVITAPGGKYRQLSDEEKKADPNISGIYTYTYRGGFNCGNTVFALQETITHFNDDTVDHNRGWFGIANDGISVPVMGNHTHRKGVLDSLHTGEDGKTTLKYVLTDEDSRVDYPPVEIGKPVFIIDGKLSRGLANSTLVESTRFVSQKSHDGSIEWTGTRIQIFPGGNSVLYRGKFCTTAEGVTSSSSDEFQTYLGTTTISPKFSNSDGREIRNDFVYKFIPEIIKK